MTGTISGDTPATGPEWFWECDADLRFTYVSYARAPKSPEHIIGRRRQDLGGYDPADPNWARHLADLEARRPFFGFEYAIPGPNGTPRYLSVSGEPRFAPDGTFLGYRGAASDITERKRFERALQDSRDWLRAVLDNTPVEVALKDTQGRLIDVNPAFLDIYGFTRAEVIGKTAREYFRPEFGDVFAAHDREVLETGRPLTAEERAPRADGTVHDYLVARFPIANRNGETIGTGMTAMDVTEQKRAEREARERGERLRTVTDNLPAVLTHWDRDERFRFVNRVAEVWYGRPAAEIVGRTITEVFGAEVREAVRPGIEAVLAGEPVHFEQKMRYPDGVIRDVEIAYFPDFDADGAVRGAFAHVQDIGDRKRLEEQLLRRERLAAMGNLTATVAHELRNPLGAVASSVAAIRQKARESGVDLERALTRADRGIARCDRIVTELLDFVRATGLQPKPTAIDAWLEDVLADIPPHPGITVTLTPGTGDAVIAFDRGALRRAVVNVVENACQAIAGAVVEGGRPEGRVTVATRIAGGRAEIAVTDTGPGIPADILPRVTEPLFSTKSFGTGLGLPTVQRIMEEHGGGLRIDSAPGHGATVTPWLPAAGGNAKGGAA